VLEASGLAAQMSVAEGIERFAAQQRRPGVTIDQRR